MNLKELVFVIIGIIALLGSLALMYALVIVGGALGAFETNIAGLPNLDAAGMQDFFGQARLLVTIGWIWALTVLITSAYSVMNGVKKLKTKK